MSDVQKDASAESTPRVATMPHLCRSCCKSCMLQELEKSGKKSTHLNIQPALSCRTFSCDVLPDLLQITDFCLAKNRQGNIFRKVHCHLCRLLSGVSCVAMAKSGQSLSCARTAV